LNSSELIFSRSAPLITSAVPSGYLLFPREYEDLDQLSVNLYMELLGQQTL